MSLVKAVFYYFIPIRISLKHKCNTYGKIIVTHIDLATINVQSINRNK